MSYLDMILNEAATPVAEKNKVKSQKVSNADKALAKKYSKEYGKSKRSSFMVGYHSSTTSSMDKIKKRMDNLAAAIQSGVDSQGRKLNPDKIRRYKEEYADLKRAYKALEISKKGKASSTQRSFGYRVNRASTSQGISGNKTNDDSNGKTDVTTKGKDKIYLEGYLTAMDEMGLLDEDYEEDFDDYDAFDEEYDDFDDYDAFDEEYDDFEEEDMEDEMDEAYNEGYVTALEEMGLL